MNEMEQVLSSAQAFLQAHRYDEAIARFELYLKNHPGDLKALLQLGICHLLNRSETVFLRIYDRAVLLKSKMTSVPDDVLRTFAYYEGLVKKVTAAALVLGTVAAGASGCNSAHKYSGGVYLDDAGFDGLPTDTQSDEGVTDNGTESVDTQWDTATSAHRYSGGVALDTETQE